MIKTINIIPTHSCKVMKKWRKEIKNLHGLDILWAKQANLSSQYCTE
jgi:hypothetical protein